MFSFKRQSTNRQFSISTHFAFLTLLLQSLVATAEQKPNIVMILADDMGYGDPACYNVESKCTTPHIDRLASRGMRFTDAHAAGSWCVPSRYGLLTGRYAFRAESFDTKRPVIKASTATVAKTLRDAGYQ
ncbi:MAG: sulfatase-like hydrolase/transferase, partial [Planctomycetota bacterium]